MFSFFPKEEKLQHPRIKIFVENLLPSPLYRSEFDRMFRPRSASPPSPRLWSPALSLRPQARSLSDSSPPAPASPTPALQSPGRRSARQRPAPAQLIRRKNSPVIRGKLPEKSVYTGHDSIRPGRVSCPSGLPSGSGRWRISAGLTLSSATFAQQCCLKLYGAVCD